MDVDGRVVRLESFSKVVSPGSRVGWIVASEQIIERFVRNFEVSSQNPSGISQLVLYKLLDEHWGHSGYLDWLIALRMSYTDRRDALLHACEKHLPREIAHWVAPAAGMFVSYH
jgi:aromatic amino acid aminotransferase I